MRLALMFLLAALLVPPAASAQQQQLAIDFDGGYAFVVAGGKSLEVGPVKKPHILSLNYQKHPLILTITSGLIDPKTTLPTKRVGHGGDATIGWDLSDFVVEVTDDGDILKKEPVTLPPTEPPVGECSEEVPDENHRHFMADVTKITGENVLEADWQTRLTGRVVLGGGELRVRAILDGCFAFSEGGGTRHLAHGEEGMTYLHGFTGKSIILKVKPTKGGQEEQIIVAPKNGVVRLAFRTRHGITSTPNKAIKHFKHYYWLFKNDIPDEKRQIPTWLGRGRGNITPGEACPPVLFEVP